MNKQTIVFLCALIGAFAALADIHYVNKDNASPVSPFTNGWASAATDIQMAVSVATNSDTVLVTNGTYTLTNQISISKGITVKSVNGREVTIVDGNYPTVATRCFSITHSNAVVDGFKIYNGGVANYGGGVYMTSGTVQNCTIDGNRVTVGYGGGVYMGSGVLSNCIVSGNSNPGRTGGGIYIYGGTAQNCVIISNVADSGGGMFFGNASTARNCIISGNTSTNYRGGGVAMAVSTFTILLENCLLEKNAAPNWWAGGIYVTTPTIMRNCTVVSNTAASNRGGAGFVTERALTLQNSIVYHNSAGGNVASNYLNWVGTSSFSNSCFAPAMTGEATNYSANNITSDPMFAGTAVGCFRLSAGSPCCNTGANAPWMTNAVDLDGYARIVSGVVDMGCYERFLSLVMQPVPGADGGGEVNDYRIGATETKVIEYVEFLNAAEAGGAIAIANGQVRKTTTQNLYCLTAAATGSTAVAYDSGRSLGQRFYCAPDMREQPVVCVSWFGAAAFCNWMSEEDDLTAVYQDANGWTATLGNSGYRLPTEAQWLKAAAWNKNTGRFFDYGTSTNTINGASANYLDSGDTSETNALRTMAVGSYTASSPYDLKDASGNVWEWCQDFFDQAGSDPDVDMHAARGGGWGNLATDVKTSSRSGIKPSQTLNSVGFRVTAPMEE